MLEGTAEDMLKDLRSFAENEWVFAAREHQMPQGVSQADEPLAKPYERKITVTLARASPSHASIVEATTMQRIAPIGSRHLGAAQAGDTPEEPPVQARRARKEKSGCVKLTGTSADSDGLLLA